ncbi:hypothetical protein H6795_00885 [Candidatus Nomurabacteria bacterium]|nr:hypothetical protein [Candidatus Nomurabacteria bacterium]
MSTAMFFPEARPEPNVAGSIFTNEITAALHNVIQQVRNNGSIIATCTIDSDAYKDPTLVTLTCKVIGETAITRYLEEKYLSNTCS